MASAIVREGALVVYQIDEPILERDGKYTCCYQLYKDPWTPRFTSRHDTANAASLEAFEAVLELMGG